MKRVVPLLAANSLLGFQVIVADAQTLEGTWEGQVRIDGVASGELPRELNIDYEFAMRVELDGDEARISVTGSEPWEPGEVRFRRLRASAIIFGVTKIDSTTDNWVVTVTERDRDSVLVFFSRVINLGGAVAGEVNAFAVGGWGELQKTVVD